MIDLMEVYECLVHGEVLADEVDRLEVIDHENDDVYIVFEHRQPCGHEVLPKRNGELQVLAQVDHERWLWWVGAYDGLWGDGHA